MRVVTHLIFAECCWFATSAVFDIHYEIPAVLVTAATSVLPDADHPKSWIGHQLVHDQATFCATVRCS